jgi:hypothetical protein
VAANPWQGIFLTGAQSTPTTGPTIYFVWTQRVIILLCDSRFLLTSGVNEFVDISQVQNFVE